MGIKSEWERKFERIFFIQRIFIFIYIKNMMFKHFNFQSIQVLNVCICIYKLDVVDFFFLILYLFLYFSFHVFIFWGMINRCIFSLVYGFICILCRFIGLDWGFCQIFFVVGNFILDLYWILLILWILVCEQKKFCC